MRKKSALDRITTAGDTFLKEDELRPDDIIIPIMGQTGAGKSTFVNNVFDAKVADVSDGFQSTTQKMAHYIMPIPTHWATRYGIGADSRVVLLDTPGFDDTNVSDSEILRRIAVWLAASYGAKTKVAGIVYVHPIYPNRMTRNDCSNVKVFHKICGDTGLSKVVLATTRWEISPPSAAEKREEEVINSFWRNLHPHPNSAEEKTKTMRLLNTTDSAREVVKAILEQVAQLKINGVILGIQDQLVIRNKRFQQTEAAKELRSKLVDLLNATKSSSSEDRRERLRSLVQQTTDLKIPLGVRIKAMLGLD